ncbi:MAG: competence/damage-inducible protein A [Proteobacteria bacterium]|nr:competence/damage-inducible protein A [Pseudomonadota bacterium]MBU4385102.1 competence/damage-inducible protein A [Pseudomonadota bacterium]MCG2764709.1 molybdopterin-binding protein [Desulfarculaceae bacterium]
MSHDAAQSRLFNKTEIFIKGLVLKDVDLGAVASVVAHELGIARDKVLVIDARDDLISLDVLQQSIETQKIVGREPELLEALGQVPGLSLTEDACIHSQGVLGMLGVQGVSARQLASKVAATESMIERMVANRCLVFPTGNEIIESKITDTNTPFLVDAMHGAGFTAQAGEVLPDDEDVLVGKLLEAASMGFGVVLSTGGTGAEKKDCMVEAIQKIDPDAAASYIVHFTKGQGRHHKDGVRIAVGQVDRTIFVALPGPHSEVAQATPTLLEGLERRWSKKELADALAALLRGNYIH